MAKQAKAGGFTRRELIGFYGQEAAQTRSMIAVIDRRLGLSAFKAKAADYRVKRRQLDALLRDGLPRPV